MNFKRFFILIIAIAFVVIHYDPVFSSDSVSVMGEVYHGDNRKIDSLEQELKSPQDIRNAPVIEVTQDILKSRRAAMSDDSVPNQIGFARQIESLSEHQGFKKTLNWLEIQGGGHTATIIISSPEAKALRVGIIVNKLPQETEFHFFETNNGTIGLSATLITGKQINHLLQLNKTADPDHPDSQTYWSPTVAGESMGIEIYLPPGIHPDNFDIAIPFLSHLFVSPFISSSESSLKPLSYGDSKPCQNDATCYPGWLNIRNSVAHIVFTKSGGSYICTGTLLNDTDPGSSIPYFITATHCIGSQTVASTLETHWFFESASCNSTTQNPNYTTKSGGAKLHWSKGTTTDDLDSNQDVSFLELNDTPPSGVYYAGWNSTIDSGTVTGIHHPEGDWKKLSMGDQDGDYKVWGDTSFNTSPSINGNFRRVHFTDGGIEPGSSGSGLFNNNNQLVGTLWGTDGLCEGANGYYSKFGAAYSTGNLFQWLGVPAPAPPILSSPASNANVAGTSVNLSWSYSSGATQYWLWARRTSDNVLIFNQNIGNYTSYNLTGLPNNGDNYYWMVRAGNSSGWSKWAAARRFFNGTATIPAPPILSSPASNANVAGASVNLSWSASAGATQYLLWSRRTSDNGVIFNQNIGNNTFYTLTGLPNNGDNYYWMVRAGNSSGWSGWTVPRRFYNGTAAIPAPPVLSSPANNANVAGTSVNLSWNASFGAAQYWLWVRRTIDNTVIFNQSVGNNTFYNLTGLPNTGGSYYWMVRAINSSGWSGWTAARRFFNGPS